MMYDPKQIYINGDSFRVGGADGSLLRQLADDRQLGAAQVARLSSDAREALQDWADNGWLKPV
jgi:50S ribosomal protein L16 3-hydroxylase